MKCRKCGNEVKESMIVCPTCGTTIQSEEKKKSRVGLIILILLITALGIAAIWYGIHLMSSPKNIMLTNIPKFASELREVLNKGNLINNTDNLNIESQLTVTLPGSTGSQTITLNAKSHQDNINKLAEYALDATYGGMELLSLSGFQDANNIYVGLSEPVQYYSMASEFFSIADMMPEGSDYVVFLDILADTLDKTMEDGDFTKEDVEVTLGNSSEKLKKYTYQLTPERIQKIVEEYLAEVKANDTAINLLQTMSSLSKEQVTAQIDSFISMLPNMFQAQNLQTADISIYVRGMNQVMITELSVQGSSVQIQNYDQTTRISVKAVINGQTQEAYLSIVKENDNQYRFEGDIFGLGKIEGTYVKNSELSDSLHLIATVGQLEVEVNLDGVTEEVTKGSNYKSSISGNVIVKSSGVSMEVGLALDSVIQEGTEIVLDVDGAKDINSLTEEEQLELMQAIENLPIYQFIQMFSQSNDLEVEDEIELY